MNKDIRIGKIQNDFIDLKMEIRRLVDTFTPQENENLDNLLSEVDKLIKSAEIEKLKKEGFLK